MRDAGKNPQKFPQTFLPRAQQRTVLAQCHLKLSPKSSAIFPASKLPAGSSLVRVAMSVNQAGAGYLGGFSRTLSYKRGR